MVKRRSSKSIFSRKSKRRNTIRSNRSRRKNISNKNFKRKSNRKRNIKRKNIKRKNSQRRKKSLRKNIRGGGDDEDGQQTAPPVAEDEWNTDGTFSDYRSKLLDFLYGAHAPLLMDEPGFEELRQIFELVNKEASEEHGANFLDDAKSLISRLLEEEDDGRDTEGSKNSLFKALMSFFKPIFEGIENDVSDGGYPSVSWEDLKIFSEHLERFTNVHFAAQTWLDQKNDDAWHGDAGGKETFATIYLLLYVFSTMNIDTFNKIIRKSVFMDFSDGEISRILKLFKKKLKKVWLEWLVERSIPIKSPRWFNAEGKFNSGDPFVSMRETKTASSKVLSPRFYQFQDQVKEWVVKVSSELSDEFLDWNKGSDGKNVDEVREDLHMLSNMYDGENLLSEVKRLLAEEYDQSLKKAHYLIVDWIGREPIDKNSDLWADMLEHLESADSEIVRRILDNSRERNLSYRQAQEILEEGLEFKYASDPLKKNLEIELEKVRKNLELAPSLGSVGPVSTQVSPPPPVRDTGPESVRGNSMTLPQDGDSQMGKDEDDQDDDSQMREDDVDEEMGGRDEDFLALAEGVWKELVDGKEHEVLENNDVEDLLKRLHGEEVTVDDVKDYMENFSLPGSGVISREDFEWWLKDTWVPPSQLEEEDGDDPDRVDAAQEDVPAADPQEEVEGALDRVDDAREEEEEDREKGDEYVVEIIINPGDSYGIGIEEDNGRVKIGRISREDLFDVRIGDIIIEVNGKVLEGTYKAKSGVIIAAKKIAEKGEEEKDRKVTLKLRRG